MFEPSLGPPKYLTKDKSTDYRFPSLLFKFSLKSCQFFLVKKKEEMPIANSAWHALCAYNTAQVTLVSKLR